MDIVRDPLWNNIRLDPLAMALVDTGAMQRLRYVRQLGLAHLVYPGATHTRFEHALGTQHLARLTLGILHERGDLRGLLPMKQPSCALRTRTISDTTLRTRAGGDRRSAPRGRWPRAHHQRRVAQLLAERISADARSAAALVRGRSDSPLQGLVSGSLDLDKIEYLKRDAHMCGVRTAKSTSTVSSTRSPL